MPRNVDDGTPAPDDRSSRNARASLPVGGKVVYALGDHSVNLVLSATSFFYLIFLTDYVGLGAGLAG